MRKCVSAADQTDMCYYMLQAIRIATIELYGHNESENVSVVGMTSCTACVSAYSPSHVNVVRTRAISSFSAAVLVTHILLATPGRQI